MIVKLLKMLVLRYWIIIKNNNYDVNIKNDFTIKNEIQEPQPTLLRRSQKTVKPPERLNL